MTNLPLPSPLRRRWLFVQTPAEKVLALSSLFSCLLVAARIFHTGKLTFAFMPWNLFLAWLPYLISSGLTRTGSRFVRVTGLVIWLLFIPNSFYILTDLYHLADGHRNPRVPEWYDLVLILSFAMNGLLLGIRSAQQVEKLLAPDASFLGRWVFLYPIMWLNSLGVYIGRVLRYNSWDIVSNPIDLVGDMARMIVHPLRFHDAWSMIFCYSILLTIMYSLYGKYHQPVLES